MKQKTITTDKATVLVVELLEGAKPHNSYCDAILYTLPDGYVETEYPVESDGSWEWQLLGRLPDITEEQAEKLVERHYMDGCRSYDIFRYYLLSSEDGRWTDDSLYSLSSLLQANEVYFNNTFMIKPTVMDFAPYCHMEGGNTTSRMTDDDWREYETHLQEWQEAQSKVFDKERTYLFIKVD